VHLDLDRQPGPGERDQVRRVGVVVGASRLRERVNLYLALGGDFEGTGAPK